MGKEVRAFLPHFVLIRFPYPAILFPWNPAALAYLRVMFSAAPGTGTVLLLPWLGLAVIGAVAAGPWAKALWEKYRDRKWMPLAEALLSLAALLLCVGSLVSDSYNPFLYFRF